MGANLAVNAKKAPLFVWDTHSIYKAEMEYHMTEHGLDEDAAWERAVGDCNVLTLAWEDLCAWVEDWMNTNDFHHFYTEATNMTWRNFDGAKMFVADTGEDFIRQVVGLDCDYSLSLYERGKPGDDGYHLYGSVRHHDSPAGEGRVVYLVAGCDECAKPIRDGEEHVIEDRWYEGVYCEDCIGRMRDLSECEEA